MAGNIIGRVPILLGRMLAPGKGVIVRRRCLRCQIFAFGNKLGRWLMINDLIGWWQTHVWGCVFGDLGGIVFSGFFRFGWKVTATVSKKETYRQAKENFMSFQVEIPILRCQPCVMNLTREPRIFSLHEYQIAIDIIFLCLCNDIMDIIGFVK